MTMEDYSGRPDDDDDLSNSDNENSPLHGTSYYESGRTLHDTKHWDVFRTLPTGNESRSSEQTRLLDFLVVLLKLIVYVITFGVVLVCGLVNTGLVLFMTSQLRTEKSLKYCDNDRSKEFVVNSNYKDAVAWVWCLYICFIVVEIFVLFRSARICVFKSYKKSSAGDFLVVLLFESFHVVGLALLVYTVLPQMDAVRGSMITTCVCLIPGLFGMMSRNSDESHRFFKTLIDIVAICIQLTGYVVIPLLDEHDPQVTWTIPLALLLTSFGWWENYVDKKAPLKLIRSLGGIKARLKKTRYYTYVFISMWKMVLFTAAMLLIQSVQMGAHFSDLFLMFTHSFASHNMTRTELLPYSSAVVPDASTVPKFHDVVTVPTTSYIPLYFLLVQIIVALVCYIFVKFACKIWIQGFSFAVPINICIPVAISLLIAACGLRESDTCAFSEWIPKYLFWECPKVNFVEYLTNRHMWIFVPWLFAQTWITVHIWTPKCERLASTEKLFVTPMYTPFLLVQSLLLNRRRDEEGDVRTEELELDREMTEDAQQYYETISVHTDTSGSKPMDNITKIYACATMWHETKVEMTDMLKSIFRMDEDHAAFRSQMKYFRIVNPDYYDFETQVFFDDAFQVSDDNDDENVINRFVSDLVMVIDDAAASVHKTNVRVRPPAKYPTPYGGRLVWTLPGKTKLVVHLKDKSKIRHKKRWSQVMYMYYLLGYKLMDQNISVDRKDAMASSTYILTLDGDIDFQPKAVKLLVDLMKKNKNLGAACGRIHPVGSGPMVWYQKFEYAIGHWLQKATEHMIGCVLCSPGCFSLFRAKALMDDNVMKRYTKISDEARHYVQYDQGEDRWLCTLLLQRGYRVEYSAASDAYTHAPEGFNEFYNQRRRWVPSTIANIMDLLMDYKRTIEVNDNISLPYIVYQSMLMAGTILGPGTIFLMLVGAFVAAFRIDNWTSFYANAFPIVFFVIICFTTRPKIQVIIAQILSTNYALIMMAVIVGTTLQLNEDGVESPSAIFLILIIGSFVISAMFHPQEFGCIIHGFLYLLSIPSMYLLLILYSLTNLNVVSWGTREVQTKKTKQELEQERKEAEEAKKKSKQNALMGLLGRTNVDVNDKEGHLEFNCGNIFRIMLCTQPRAERDRQHLAKISLSLDELAKRLENLERVLDPGLAQRRKSSRGSVRSVRLGGGTALGTDMASLAEEAEFPEDDDSSRFSEDSSIRQERDDLINPYWIEDKRLKRGEVKHLEHSEIQFWRDLIEKYLHPLDDDKEKKKQIEVDLKELRNKSFFAFFMANALFILIVFLLQLKKDDLHVRWPFGIKTNITFIEETEEVIIHKDYLQLEPIGLVFVFFFGTILVIQFLAMLFHRFGTMSHILASTEIFCPCRKKKEQSEKDPLEGTRGVEIIKDMQKLKGLDDDYGYTRDGSDRNDLSNRRTIHKLEQKYNHRKKPIGTLDVAFKKRWFSQGAHGVNDPKTAEELEHRRTIYQDDRRHTKMETLGANNEIYPNRQRHRHANGGLQDLFKGTTGTDNEGYERGSDDGYGMYSMERGSNRNSITWRQENELQGSRM